jgi:hypothetical protein
MAFGDRIEEKMTAMQSDALAKKAEAEMKAAEAALANADLEKRRMDLMERQIALQEQQSASLSTQVQRTAPKENPNYIARGPFTDPRGNPWSKSLKCPIFDGPIPLHEAETLTEAEVVQLNRLQPLERGRIQKADRSLVNARVVPTYDAQSRLSKLVIERPMGKDDNAQHFPPMDEMAKQLADQAEAQMAAVPA